MKSHFPIYLGADTVRYYHSYLIDCGYSVLPSITLPYLDFFILCLALIQAHISIPSRIRFWRDRM